ncbi:DNA methyltransferase [Thermoanaerobacter pentosaceus]|uniref:Adenine-specific DNA-methyltransferase n=1 Tax=Thermoanaerobacter pentosaceus TaxID=694059 RepID=A0ABT9M2G1_9THEO|nr:site-specific DNA-methyltransferase [Thermoanaerobacter pentosaceus]MDP9750291.1 adenine-specific DNA-methyltransferase [Thermoanaerobacter pentosaceus]
MSVNGGLKEKLKNYLRDIFQFDKEDLDFGIYKILNYKRDKIEEFIEKDLIEQIEKELNKISEAERQELEERKSQLEQQNSIKKYIEAKTRGDENRIKIYKEDFPEQIAEYEEILRQLEKIKVTDELEKEIYNHLINFFSRYYADGDFISQRRYGKNEKYVIPYNGEEVMLYWANHDQYYIKTTEYFRKYTFKNGTLTVNFRVVSAQEENGNAKSQEKKYFVLNEKIYDYDKGKNELNIYFEYRILTEEEKQQYGSQNIQETINQQTLSILREKIKPEYLLELLYAPQQDGKTVIEKHLNRYTKKNTTDYFIHKDLKGFLERELDFYIKNEFLKLDDLQVLEQSGYFDKLRMYLIGVKAFKRIATKIIDFLAQIENFQKMLWEKKKFVLSTHYVITLDKLREYTSEEFLQSIIDDILKNEAQLNEWKELYRIEVKSKEDLLVDGQLQLGENGYKKLPIDTRYFDEEFKWKLLVAITEKNDNDLDKILDGILIKSENWQALNLLMNKYKGMIKTIYIDPPYNTGNDDFLYKDSYQHSSWLSMMENRLRLARELMKDDGVIFVSIDDNENYTLENIMHSLFDYIDTFIIKSNPRGNQAKKITASMHEYVLVFSKGIFRNKLGFLKIEGDISEFKYEDNKGQYREIGLRKRGAGAKREDAPNLYYPIYYDPQTKQIHLTKVKSNLIEILPLLEDGSDGRWRWSKEKLLENIDKVLCRKVKRRDGSEAYDVFEKDYLTEEKIEKVKSIFDEKEVNYENATEEIKHMGLYYKYPKPVYLIIKLIRTLSYLSKSYIILDFFAGSGTTAHAVMKLNKEDGGKRKFILVEIADYFYTTIIPRIKKVVYSFNWKDGIPQDMDGSGIFFKYHTIEQYEDALENVELEQVPDVFYTLEDYFVKYFLEWETKDSPTLLNIEKLKDPFNYKLKILDNYEQKEVNVDIIETFNYLLGLHVKGYKIFEDTNRKYVFVFGKKEGKEVVIIWRSIKDLDLEKDKEFIENVLKRYNVDEIYINGNAVLSKEYKIIEPIFKKLMFEEVQN